MTGSVYARLAKPVLFRLDAERAHDLTLRAAMAAGEHAISRRVVRTAMAQGSSASGRTASAGVHLLGLRFENRLGLAAGMDKNGSAIPTWSALGFGHVEVGTVTAIAQGGNAAPRMFRLRDSGALINRMGFNNHGAHALAMRLRAHRAAGLIDIPVGVSIGKSKVTPVTRATDDYLTSLAAVRDLADYIAINVSSPNTPGLRSLQDAEPLRELLSAVVGAADATPVLVKLAPDLTESAIDEALQVATDAGISGIIASNTTLGRDGLDPGDRDLAAENGGLSGRPLTVRSRDMVARICAVSDFPVIGVGGIMSADDARAMLDAGASLVQVYTGLVYSGPSLIHDILGL